MRIDPLGGEPLKNQEVKGKKVKRGSSIREVKKGDFFETLGRIEAEKLEELLHEAVEEILEAGNDLVRSPTSVNLEKYKNAIKRFLKLVEKNLYKLAGKVDPATGRIRLHMIAEEVNEKLQELAEKVMSGERRTINWVAKVEEINGLILNLYR